MDYSLPGSSSTGKLQARILEWVATPDLPYPGIEPTSPALQVDSLLLNHIWSLLLSVTRGKAVPFNKGTFPPKGRV